MEVPPHPHTGLQTVTWLLDGEILHRDSLGNVQPIRPGQLNVMTSGNGIAHSERSPATHPPVMHGCSCGWHCRTRREPELPISRTTPTCRAGGTVIWTSPFWLASSPGSGHRQWCTPRWSACSWSWWARRRRRCRCGPISSTRCWRCPGRRRPPGSGSSLGRCSIWARVDGS
ncbi:pirin family protein [Micromonospora sp. M12]